MGRHRGVVREGNRDSASPCFFFCDDAFLVIEKHIEKGTPLVQISAFPRQIGVYLVQISDLI